MKHSQIYDSLLFEYCLFGFLSKLAEFSSILMFWSIRLWSVAPAARVDSREQRSQHCPRPVVQGADSVENLAVLL